MQTFDPIEKYFECYSECEIQSDQAVCIERCVEILRNNDGSYDTN